MILLEMGMELVIPRAKSRWKEPRAGAFFFRRRHHSATRHIRQLLPHNRILKFLELFCNKIY